MFTGCSCGVDRNSSDRLKANPALRFQPGRADSLCGTGRLHRHLHGCQRNALGRLLRTFAPQKPVASSLTLIPPGTPTGWASSPPLRQEDSLEPVGYGAAGNAPLRQLFMGVGAATGPGFGPPALCPRTPSGGCLLPPGRALRPICRPSDAFELPVALSFTRDL